MFPILNPPFLCLVHSLDEQKVIHICFCNRRNSRWNSKRPKEMPQMEILSILSGGSQRFDYSNKCDRVS